MKRSGGAAAEVITKLIASQQHAMARAFEEATQFKHKNLRGGQREDGVREFLNGQLPSSLKVSTGEAVDRYGNTSAQIDVMVYDATLNSPFIGESNDLLPAEALLAIVEVKTKLTKAEWHKIADAVSKFQKLRPYQSKFAPLGAGKGGVVDPLPRCHYSVIAFSSNLAASESWADREWKRALETFGENHDPHLDRVLILDRGIINPVENSYRPSASQGENLLAWFVGLANFLNREVPRRKPMDWQNYAGRSFGGWKPLAKETQL